MLTPLNPDTITSAPFLPRLMVLVLLVFGGLLYVATSDEPAQAATTSAVQPYGGCDEAWQAPRSEGAAECRTRGWLIRSGYVVSPRSVLRYYNLPFCRNEDGSGQRQACGWNVTEGDGDGHGRVYLSVPSRGHRDDWTIYLRICIDGTCKPWVR